MIKILIIDPNINYDLKKYKNKPPHRILRENKINYKR